MSFLNPINQTQLYGLSIFFNDLKKLYTNNNLPNKILFNGQKGLGKSTLAYHFINYSLSKNEDYKYDTINFKINSQNKSFKLSLNKTNPNFFLIDVIDEKKLIGIDQIRELIIKLNKSSFNDKPRFVLIDNIEYLNISSINALLKTLEEPTPNTYFILINSNRKILDTVTSRCIKFNISLSNIENLEIANKLLDGDLKETINEKLINYYLTPGNIYNLALFAKKNDYDLSSYSLKDFLKILIGNNHYTKDKQIKYLIYDFIEYYLCKMDFKFPVKINDKYNYFIKRISNTKKFNLDEESLFLEFQKKILNE
tara:strand:+ start:505 stop:1437 length:933 start_codon:yes stop_codon:yes gene_type:complete